MLPENSKVLVTSCSIRKKLGLITIPASSELIFDDANIDISVTGIRVLGKLRAGSETCHLKAHQSITLRGARPESVASPEKKGIDVDGGVLEIHAAEFYHTWSRLAVTALPGDSFLLIQDPVNWDIGSTIVVTSTQLKDSRDWHQNELFKITKAKAASHLGEGVTAIFLDKAVEFAHYGQDEYQAEVGLLTRRFVIQGDASDSEPTDIEPMACSSDKFASFPCPESYLTGYGGHVIIQGETGEARVTGVEFYRMGQTNFLGRYPIHWHLAGNVKKDSYVRASSIHRSFFKCVTLHGTDNVLVSRNVAFDVIGHCLYLEDGVEENNRIEFNLHAHVHPIGMPPGNGNSQQYLEDIKSGPNLVTASDATAAAFYVSNNYNIFRGNAAVGGYAGFIFPILPSPIGLFRGLDRSPRQAMTLEFDGNSCRSAGHWWGHAGCLYMGGVFKYEDDDSLDPLAPMIYNPGRSVGLQLQTCQMDRPGSCPTWEKPECSEGSYPTACYAYLTLTNTKVALSNVGVMTWGERSRISKIEAHDMNGGPFAELFGDNSVDQALVTCESDNHYIEHWCDPQSPHKGHSLDSLDCRYFDRRFYENKRKVLQWYDTNMNTIVSNATIRKCDPKRWHMSGKKCTGQCLKSVVFTSLTHSNQFLPEFMSLTAAINYEDDPDIKDHVLGMQTTSSQSVSGRTAAWMDLDGGICGGDKWGPTIIGSNHDAGEWWKLEDDCELLGIDAGEMWCCQARNRFLASLYFTWDASLESQLKGNGAGKLCENASTKKSSACPRVGYLAQFGQVGALEDIGLKVNYRPEFTGPVPTADADKGSGWYFWLDQGAPKELVLSQLQIHHKAIFLLAIPYPKGTSFQIAMKGQRIQKWCGDTTLCEFDYERIWNRWTFFEAQQSQKEPKYFVDTSTSGYDLLYVRVMQRDDRALSYDGTNWDETYVSSMFKNAYIENLPDTDYWGLPYRSGQITVTITADCEADGAYCNGGPLPQEIPPLMWHKNTPKPTQSPTRRPTPLPTTSAEPIRVVGFALVNAETDVDVGLLVDGENVAPSAFPSAAANIRAVVSGDVKRVKLELISLTTKVEWAAPFALFGDDNGDYRPGSLAFDRVYSLKATPFDKSGVVYPATTITFTIRGPLDLSTLRIQDFAWGGLNTDVYKVTNDNKLEITNATWIAVELPEPHILSKYSSLAFCYASNSEPGKTHAIGLTDDPSDGKFGKWFDIMGTNGAWDKSITDAGRYRSGLQFRGTTQCFDLPLAPEPYPVDATVSHLTFVNNLDSAKPQPYQGSYSEMVLRTNDDCNAALDFSSAPMSNFTDWGPSTDDFHVEQSGCRVSLRQSTWKAFRLPNTHRVTEKTQLHFCYEQKNSCEIHAISATATKDKLNGGPVFMVDGWNRAWHLPTRDFTYDTQSLTTQCFQIPLAPNYLNIGDAINFISFINKCNDDFTESTWSKVKVIDL